MEPVVGTLINFLNMKQVNKRGIKQANKCLLIATILYNIKKMMKFNTLKPIVMVVSMTKKYNQKMLYLYLKVIIQLAKSKIEISDC